jgi:hypothetical protein
VEGFLRQNETNVIVENGGTYPPRLLGTWEELKASLTVALIQDEETPEVPEEKKAIFYAAVELAV